MAFEIIRNDITRVIADAIVNSANPAPICGTGADSAIYHAAGYDALLAERRKIGTLAPGEVAVTPAFNLSAKFILHTVGPVWQDGYHGELETLTACYRKVKLKTKFSFFMKSGKISVNYKDLSVQMSHYTLK